VSTINAANPKKIQEKGYFRPTALSMKQSPGEGRQLLVKLRTLLSV